MERITSNPNYINNNKTNQTKRRRRKKRKLDIRKLLIFIIIIIGIVVLINNINKPKQIIGKWKLDDVTQYRFDKDKTGKLILPSTEYEFTYKIDSNRLSINFKNDSIKDSNYKYEVKDNTLNLSGTDGTTGEYYLNKQK